MLFSMKTLSVGSSRGSPEQDVDCLCANESELPAEQLLRVVDL